MPQAIKAVEDERKRQRSLESDLRDERQRRKAGHQRRAVPVPAQQRCHQIPEAKDVEAARQHAARDAVQCRRVPGDLRAVDGQVRGHRACEPLLREDVGFAGLEDLLSCLAPLHQVCACCNCGRRSESEGGDGLAGGHCEWTVSCCGGDGFSSMDAYAFEMKLVVCVEQAFLLDLLNSMRGD